MASIPPSIDHPCRSSLDRPRTQSIRWLPRLPSSVARRTPRGLLLLLRIGLRGDDLEETTTTSQMRRRRGGGAPLPPSRSAHRFRIGFDVRVGVLVVLGGGAAGGRRVVCRPGSGSESESEPEPSRPEPSNLRSRRRRHRSVEARGERDRRRAVKVADEVAGHGDTRGRVRRIRNCVRPFRKTTVLEGGGGGGKPPQRAREGGCRGGGRRTDLRAAVRVPGGVHPRVQGGERRQGRLPRPSALATGRAAPTSGGMRRGRKRRRTGPSSERQLIPQTTLSTCLERSPRRQVRKEE